MSDIAVIYASHYGFTEAYARWLAEELAADAFGAAHAFLMVGGTTSSVQSMVLTACKRGDEIILPRNVHRSVINALCSSL